MSFVGLNLVQYDCPYEDSLILSLVQNDQSYALISDLLSVSRDDIKALVYMHLPHFDDDEIIRLNFCEIEQLVDKRIPIDIIARRYGIQKNSLCRYIIDALPEQTMDMLEHIKTDPLTGDRWMFSGSTWYKV